MKRFDRSRPWRLGLTGLSAALGLAAAVLVACGGGVGTGGTGGFASGPITGFGSVIVNSVRFDDSSATVTDGDGLAHTRDDLRLGMTVEVDGSNITASASGSTGVALRIRYDSDLLGPVSGVNASAGTFSVMGQPVVVDAATVFDASVGGVSAVKAGQVLEVFAVFDPSASNYRATRVGLAASGATPHVRGLVAQVDTSGGTLRIGSVSYGYGSVSASGVPANLGAGQYVRLSLSSSLPTGGRYAVQAFGTAVASVPDSEQGSVEGLISSFVSSRSFSVNGRPVDASAASFPNGSAGLAVGVRVEVDGPVRNGTVQATRVSIDSNTQQTDKVFELHGPITTLNAAQQSFLLRGITVSYAGSGVSFSNGTAASLAVGRQVEVKGKLSSDGLRIDATSISFE